MNSKLKINENEAKILNTIGNNAYLSNKEVAAIVGYKRINTISKKIKKFKKMNIVRGPYYDLNLSAVGENQIYNVCTDIIFDPENRDLLFEILKKIPGCRWVFPYTGLDRFFCYFQVNHYKHIGKILKFLRKKKLIQYQLFATQYRWIKYNPNFFGSPIPTKKGLRDACTLPDITYPKAHTEPQWYATDLTVMQYLQVLSDSPIEIARQEYKQRHNRLTYNQIKYSIQKIKKNNIIKSREYHISPLPREHCSTVVLLLSYDKKKELLKIMENFGKGCLLHKTYTLARSTGIMFLWTYPEAGPNILDVFDSVDSLQSRMYFLRSHGTPHLLSFSFEPELFNVDNQRWEYPSLKTQTLIEEVIKKKKGK